MDGRADFVQLSDDLPTAGHYVPNQLLGATVRHTSGITYTYCTYVSEK